MPDPKNKPITSSPEGSTPESSSPIAPEQEEFRQHLRRLAVSAVQVLLEQVMREELEQCIGASWGECTPTRRGYRNGSYTRDLVTPTGRIEDLKVPRDRAGAFHTQVFERYGRYEPEVAEALTDMFVSGTSTKTSGQSRGKTAGSGPQRQRCQSAQPCADRAVRSLARAPFARSLPHHLPGWHPFYRAPWGTNGCHHDFNRAGSRFGRQPRSAGLSCLRRGRQGWLELEARKICAAVA